LTQIVVPKKFRPDIMKLAHEGLLAGHMGTRCTALHWLEEFFRPGAQADSEDQHDGSPL
jgi:hypothetical protein